MSNKIKTKIEDKSWRPSILKEIRENKYTSVLPYTADVVIRQKKEVLELFVEDFDELEDLEYLEDLEEVEDDLEETEDDLEEIDEEVEPVKVVKEVVNTYFCEFTFKIFLNWIQVGKYLIPENQFKEIIQNNPELQREFRQKRDEIRCLLRGSSTKDILLQKELLGIKYPSPIKITKQLEQEIKALRKGEKIALGRTIKSYNLRNVDWNVMTIKKINFIAKSFVSFSKEESQLSLRKLKELEKEKMKKELETEEILALLEEDPKEGSKLLDRMKNKIKPFFYKKDGFTLRAPKNYMELYNEGLRMQNCISKLHLKPIFLKREIPLFLEKKGVIIAHLLLNDYNEIEEVRMKKNRNPNKVIEDFVEDFAKEYNLRLKFKKQYGYGDGNRFIQPFH